jgi:hypothetical protein
MTTTSCSVSAEITQDNQVLIHVFASAWILGESFRVSDHSLSNSQDRRHFPFEFCFVLLSFFMKGGVGDSQPPNHIDRVLESCHRAVEMGFHCE